jgi:DtxR family Mn-dependent transcriptional regulator
MNATTSTVEDLSLSQQRYVEIIDGLMREAGQVRMTDVAGRMQVSVPSASEAVKRLAEIGIVCRSLPLGIALTPEGRRIANQLDLRHQTLKRFMVDVMAMDPDRSDTIACRLEHCVDGEFTDRLLDLARLLEQDYPWTLRGIAEHVRMRSTDSRQGADLSIGI